MASPFDSDQARKDLFLALKQAIVASAEDENGLWYDDNLVRWTDPDDDDERPSPLDTSHLIQLDGVLDLDRLLQQLNELEITNLTQKGSDHA